MRCSQATQQLQLYLDSQLPWEKMHPLEVHLADCPTCRKELMLLEEIACALESTEMVLEPSNLTENIMQLVVRDVREREVLAHENYIPLRPSLKESLAAVLLATVAMLGILLEQPELRTSMPFAAALSQFSAIIVSMIQTLASINNGTLNALAWVLGTFLGVCITLALAGNDIREDWFKAISHRLPVR